MYTAPWQPDQCRDQSTPRELRPEQIAVIDRTAYRVLEVREREFVDWDQDAQDTWNRAGRPDPSTWPRRPMALTVRPEALPAAAPEHFVMAASEQVFVLPEHYSVCRVCAQLPPCRHNELEAAIAREQRRLAKMLEIQPGCCHACNQPIASRQRRIRFPGPNLMRPDFGDDTAVFHLRLACRFRAAEYDSRWAPAMGRPRLLYCPGQVTVHFTGRIDCTEQEDCPGDVEHASEERHHPQYGAPSTAGCWCIAAQQAAQNSPVSGGAP
jgi:hypothetical protein